MTRSARRRTTSSPRRSWPPAPTRCSRPWRRRRRCAHTTGPTPGPTAMTCLHRVPQPHGVQQDVDDVVALIGARAVADAVGVRRPLLRRPHPRPAGAHPSGSGGGSGDGRPHLGVPDVTWQSGAERGVRARQRDSAGTRRRDRADDRRDRQDQGRAAAATRSGDRAQLRQVPTAGSPETGQLHARPDPPGQWHAGRCAGHDRYRLERQRATT